MNEKICRLCLQTINNGNYQTIGQSLTNTFKLNMDISKEAVQCSECTNNLEVFFKFRSACDYMKHPPSELEDEMNSDKKNIEITDNLISFMESKSEVKCCFCTKTNKIEDLTSLTESKEHTFLVDMLKEHIPILNLNITEELLTCEICLEGLQSVFTFVMNCLDVEEKISKYAEVKGTDSKGQVELKDVQQFIFQPTVKFEIDSESVNEPEERYDSFQEGSIMQVEAEIKSEEEELDNPEFFVKTEEVDIKPELDECDSFQEPFIINETSMRRGKKCGSQHGLTYKNSEEITVYKCETCSYETQHRFNFRRHELTHKSPSEVTMHKCEVCPYETRHSIDLRRHQLNHKSPSELTMFKCDHCPYEAKRMGNLRRHQLNHKSDSDITMFKCELCPFVAKRMTGLRLHQLNHKSTSEITAFKCNVCSYRARHKGYLRRHMLIHTSTSTDITIFKCDICSFETKQKTYLKRHILRHTRHVMFKCDQCSYKSKYKQGLEGHKLIHKSASHP